MDSFQTYSPEVLKHVNNPRNMGVIRQADGMGKVGNPACGDVMKVYIRVAQRGGMEFIKDIKFQTLGCGAAIATSSMITTLAKGKRLVEAKKITNLSIAKALGGLPPIKMHCSVLAHKALRKAITNYLSKKPSF